jgi:hypothetical protein
MATNATTIREAYVALETARRVLETGRQCNVSAGEQLIYQGRVAVCEDTLAELLRPNLSRR